MEILETLPKLYEIKGDFSEFIQIFGDFRNTGTFLSHLTLQKERGEHIVRQRTSVKNGAEEKFIIIYIFF